MDFSPDLKILSLDIETTGLYPVPGKSVIWQAGFHRTGQDNPQGLNLHNDLTRRGDDLKEFFRAAKDNSIFQQEQITKGNFKDYSRAFKNGGLVEESEFVYSIFEQLKNVNVMLMQNTNFENMWLSDFLNQRPDEERNKITGRMRFATKDGNKYFYTPSEVSSQRWASDTTYSGLIDKFIKGQNIDSDLDKYVSEQKNIMNSYSRLFNTSKNKVVVADLMDFTKAFYATATASKYVDKNSLFTRPTNMEYLSQVFLSESESHSAPSDARQQLTIFNKLTRMLGEINTGKLSQDTQTVFERINRSAPYTSDVSYLTGVRQALEEAKSQGHYHVRNKLFSGNDYKFTEIDRVTGQNKEFQVRSQLPAATIKSSEYHDVIKVVSSRYAGTPAAKTIGELTTKRYKTIDEAIEDVNTRANEAKKRLTDAIYNTIPPSPSETIASAEARGKSFIEMAKNMATTKKIVVGLGLGTLGLYALGKSKKPKREKKDDPLSSDLRGQQNIPNAIISAYGYNTNVNKPIIYSGSGFYDWENRTGHHRA